MVENKIKILLKCCLFSLSYFASAALGNYLTFEPRHFAAFWLPSGIFVAVLLLHEPRFWKFFVLAAFPANLTFDLMTGKQLAVSLLFCSGNCLEALAGAWLVRRCAGRPFRLENSKHFLCLSVFSGIASTAVSAVIGAGTLSYFFEIKGFWSILGAWWTADMLGVIIAAPLILTWRHWPIFPHRVSSREWESLGLSFAAVLITALLLSDVINFGFLDTYLLLPFLIFFAMRFGPRKIAVLNLLLAVVTVWMTARGHGNLSPMRASNLEHLFRIQAFLCINVFSGMLLAWLWHERKEAQVQISLALEGSRVGLWDWRVLTGETVFNERWAEFVGYTLDELKPFDIDTWMRLCHPEDLKKSNDIMRRHMAGELPHYVCESRMRHKDGRWVWVLDQGKITERDRSGRPVRITGTHTDITERKQAEELASIQRDLGLALSSTSKLDEALRIALDIILRIDNLDSGGIYLAEKGTGGLRLAVSRGLSDAFVNSASYFPAGAPQVVLAEKGLSQFQKFSDFSFESNRARNREGLRALAVLPWQHMGRLIAVLNVASHTADAIGEHTQRTLEVIAASVGSAIARIQAEEAKAIEKDNILGLFESIEDYLFILDQGGYLRHYNHMVRDRLGYTENELARMHVLEFHPRERREEAAGVVADMLAGETTYCHVPLVTKSGILIPVETKVVLGLWNGRAALIGISRDITERCIAEEKERQETNKFQTLLDMLPGFAFYKDVAGVYITANQTLCKMLGRPREQLVGKTDQDLFPLDLAEKYRMEDQMILAGEHNYLEIEEEARLGDMRVTTLTRKVPLLTEAGEVSGLIGLALDISERKKAEDELKNAFRDKEVLLKEIHHRVKNNLQVVLSLLSLQASKLPDERLKQALADSRDRIRAMALIHEALYGSGTLSAIHLKSYAQNLVRSLLQTMVGEVGQVVTDLDIGEIVLPIDQAVPCGLILNELVTNVLKYAFPNEGKGRLTIRARMLDSEEIELIVHDNGIGLPDNIDQLKKNSLGLTLVSILKDQLLGTLDMHNDRGAVTIIRWPYSEKARRERINAG